MQFQAGVRAYLWFAVIFAFSISFLPDDAAARLPEGRLLRGKLSYKIVDHLDGSATDLLELRGVRGRRAIRLKFRTRTQRERLRDGDELQLSGRMLRASALRVAAATDAVELLSVRAAAALTGIRKVAVVKITSTDGTSACSAAGLSSLIFTGSPSVRGLFEASSFGALTFSLDGDSDGQSDVFEVTIARTTSGVCDYSAISNDATNTLAAQGRSLTTFNNKVFILPSNVSCSWAGLGSLGSGPGTSWIPGNYCNYLDVIAHEIGHNNGFHHASTDANNDGTIDNEYDDRSCTMGYGGVGVRHFNEPHKTQAGWTPPDKVIDVPAGGAVTLSAAEIDPFSTTNPQALRAVRAAGGFYYISYREAADIHSGGLPNGYRGRTSIHHGGTTIGRTYLITTIGDGQSWAAPDGSFTITQQAHGNGTVTLGVTSNSPCIPQSPSVVVTPSNVVADQPGLSRNITVTVSNNDSSSCPSTTFSLSGVVPVGFTSSFSQSALPIAPQASRSSTFTVASPANAAAGSYALQLSVQDSDGVSPVHSSVTSSATYQISTDPAPPPAAPTNLSAVIQRKINVVLSWSTPAAADLAGYLVYRDGAQIASIAGTSYTDRSVPAGQHTYLVRAVSRAGEVSEGASVVVTVPSAKKRRARLKRRKQRGGSPF